MNRVCVIALFLPVIALLSLRPVSPSVAAEPTPTVQPFQVQVVVETEGIGIPDNLILETVFAGNIISRHDDLGPNHYLDYMQVPLDSTELWIFEHEGDLGVGGQRNDESWEAFPVIVPTPFTATISIHSPGAPCGDPTTAGCRIVKSKGEPPVFVLDRNRPYHIDLQVEYTAGADSEQDYFTVTAAVR